MSIVEKLDNWMIKKAARSKVKDLFMVSKKELFSRIRELNEYIDILEWEKEKAQDNAKSLSEQVKTLSNRKGILEEINSTENELKQMKEQFKINKTELAYQGLLKKCEELQQENKGLKETINVVQGGIKTISKQNEILKERVRRAESTVETLEDANKSLKENLEQKQDKQNIKVVNHSFSKQSNNNRSVNKKNNLVITRQVNN